MKKLTTYYYKNAIRDIEWSHSAWGKDIVLALGYTVYGDFKSLSLMVKRSGGSKEVASIKKRPFLGIFSQARSSDFATALDKAQEERRPK